jgi:hypothetical protein
MKNRISQTAKSSCFSNSDTACDLFLRAHEDGSKEENDRHYRRSVPINLYMKGVILILRRRCGPLGPAPDRRPIHFRNGVGRLAGGSGRNAARYGRPSPTAAATRPTEFEQSRQWPSRPGDERSASGIGRHYLQYSTVALRCSLSSGVLTSLALLRQNSAPT